LIARHGIPQWVQGQPEELDTLRAEQEVVRKMAYRIKNYLYELPDAKGETKAMSVEKIQQMINYERETASILADALETLPRLGKGE